MADPSTLHVRNNQRRFRLDVTPLSQMAQWVADALFSPRSYEISIRLVGPRSMAHLNESYLQHKGATDVITFDLSGPETQDCLVGDIVVCPAVAFEQARTFGTSWHEETLRYVVHGLLHLKGYDDHAPKDRSRMKQQERSWMKRLQGQFDLSTWHHAIITPTRRDTQSHAPLRPAP